MFLTQFQHEAGHDIHGLSSSADLEACHCVSVIVSSSSSSSSTQQQQQQCLLFRSLAFARFHDPHRRHSTQYCQFYGQPISTSCIWQKHALVMSMPMTSTMTMVMMVMGAIVMTKSKIYSSKYTGLMATAMPGTRQWRVSLEHTAERWCQGVAYTGC